MYATPSSTHKSVCVISALRLQNELIARRLEKQEGVTCFTAESLDAARFGLGEEYDRVTLFLLDCWEKDLARGMTGLEAMDGLLPDNSSVGLFNVEKRDWKSDMTLPVQVKGLILAGGSVEDFLRGVSCMLEGKSWFPPDKRHNPAESGVCIGHVDSPDEFLTKREKSILFLIQQGKSNQQIADALGAKYKTIKNHSNNLFRKLNVSNRFQAALWAKNR